MSNKPCPKCGTFSMTEAECEQGVCYDCRRKAPAPAETTEQAYGIKLAELADAHHELANDYERAGFIDGTVALRKVENLLYAILQGREAVAILPPLAEVDPTPSELKPCPFCGGEAADPCEDGDLNIGDGWLVSCEACGANVGSFICMDGSTEPEELRASAIAAWNTRNELGGDKQVPIAVQAAGSVEHHPSTIPRSSGYQTPPVRPTPAPADAAVAEQLRATAECFAALELSQNTTVQAVGIECGEHLEKLTAILAKQVTQPADAAEVVGLIVTGKDGEFSWDDNIWDANDRDGAQEILDELDANRPQDGPHQIIEFYSRPSQPSESLRTAADIEAETPIAVGATTQPTPAARDAAAVAEAITTIENGAWFSGDCAAIKEAWVVITAILATPAPASAAAVDENVAGQIVTQMTTYRSDDRKANVALVAAMLTGYRSAILNKHATDSAGRVEQIDAMLDGLLGVFAAAGFPEPIEGFKERPQDVKHCVRDALKELADLRGRCEWLEGGYEKSKKVSAGLIRMMAEDIAKARGVNLAKVLTQYEEAALALLPGGAKEPTDAT